MPHAVWTGDLSFGLVNIPIKLFTAASAKRVRFHQHEAKTGRRIRYKRVAEGPVPHESPSSASDAVGEPPRLSVVRNPVEMEPARSLPEPLPEDPVDETEVPWGEIVKGYELERGRFVTFNEEEIESVAPEPSRVIEVEQFVQLEDIDPVYFDKSYCVIPQRGPVIERPYWLLHRTMEDAGKVAIGRFVMRTREYLVAVRPTEHMLMLETLFYDDEVRDPKELWSPSETGSSERELQVAGQLLETMTADWEPARYRDEHRRRLLDLIDAKAATTAVALPESPDESGSNQVSDLMDALLASVEQARKGVASGSSSG